MSRDQIRSLEDQRDHLNDLLAEARSEIDFLRFRVSELEAAHLPDPVRPVVDARCFPSAGTDATEQWREKEAQVPW